MLRVTKGYHRFEVVPLAVDRDEVHGLGRVELDLFANTGHRMVWSASADTGGIAPDLAKQFVLGDHSTGALHEVRHEAGLERGERNGTVGMDHRTSLEVDRALTEAEGLQGGRGHGWMAPAGVWRLLGEEAYHSTRRGGEGALRGRGASVQFDPVVR